MKDYVILIVYLIGVLISSHTISYLQRRDNVPGKWLFVMYSLSSWLFLLLCVFYELIPKIIKHK